MFQKNRGANQRIFLKHFLFSTNSGPCTLWYIIYTAYCIIQSFILNTTTISNYTITMQDSSLLFTYSGDGNHSPCLSASQRKTTLSNQVMDYEQLRDHYAANAALATAHTIAPRIRSRQRRGCGLLCCVQLPLPRRDCGRYSAATAEDCAVFSN